MDTIGATPLAVLNNLGLGEFWKSTKSASITEVMFNFRTLLELLTSLAIDVKFLMKSPFSQCFEQLYRCILGRVSLEYSGIRTYSGIYSGYSVPWEEERIKTRAKPATGTKEIACFQNILFQKLACYEWVFQWLIFESSPGKKPSWFSLHD